MAQPCAVALRAELQPPFWNQDSSARRSGDPRWKIVLSFRAFEVVVSPFKIMEGISSASLCWSYLLRVSDDITEPM